MVAVTVATSLTEAREPSRHFTPWTAGYRLQPWNASTFAVLRDCEHLREMLHSLPSKDRSDLRWLQWSDYINDIYGTGAARSVDASTLQLFRGIALRNANTSVVDRRPWECGNVRASNVRAQGVRAIVVWPIAGPYAISAYARDNEWIEVYRSNYDAYAGGEGIGYGCWFHRAVGSGIWINTGRTIGMSRAEAARRFGLPRLRDGSVDPRSIRPPCLLRRGKSCACFWCVHRVQRPGESRSVIIGPASLDNDESRVQPWNASASCDAYKAALLPDDKNAAHELLSLPCLDGLWALGASAAGFETLQLVPSSGFSPSNEAEILVAREVCLGGRRTPLGACPPPGLDVRTGTMPRTSIVPTGALALPVSTRRFPRSPICRCNEKLASQLYPNMVLGGTLPMTCE